MRHPQWHDLDFLKTFPQHGQTAEILSLLPLTLGGAGKGPGAGWGGEGRGGSP